MRFFQQNIYRRSALRFGLSLIGVVLGRQVAGHAQEAGTSSLIGELDIYDSNTRAYLGRLLVNRTGARTAEILRRGGGDAMPGIAITSDQLTPEMFGAVGDGIADDTEALASCFRAAMKIRGAILLGAKKYRFTRPLPTIVVPISIIGAGNLRTWLLFDRMAQGTAISSQNLWFGTEKEGGSGWDPNSTTVDPDSERSGLLLRGFSLVGDRSSPNPQNGLVHYDRHDNLNVRDISIHNFRGVGWGIGLPLETSNAFVRESIFFGVQVRRCGDQSLKLPAFYFASQGRGTQDVSNHVSFYDLQVVWPDGCGVLVENSHPNLDMRYIAFQGCMFHGREETSTNPQREDLVIFRGGMTCVQLASTEINGVKDRRWAVVFEKHENSTRVPRSCVLQLAAGPVANGVLFKYGKRLVLSALSLEATGTHFSVEGTFEGPLFYDGTGEEERWRAVISPEAWNRVKSYRGPKSTR